MRVKSANVVRSRQLNQFTMWAYICESDSEGVGTSPTTNLTTFHCWGFIWLFTLVCQNSVLWIFHSTELGCTDESGTFHNIGDSWEHATDSCLTCECKSDQNQICSAKQCATRTMHTCQDGTEPTAVFDVNGCCASYVCDCEYIINIQCHSAKEFNIGFFHIQLRLNRLWTGLVS